ncbi:hypothetical protein BDZ45DRAFT_650039 [Acephala macrosclerotiorum]|nr:hypothetical protein BDZ45DRAFT_650039 [Acephala macrosclerotiorum]
MTDSVFNIEEPQPKRQKRIESSRTLSQPDRSQATIYQPLDKAKREIRICDLRPAPECSDSLQCSLRIIPIDKAGKFVAFSYVWGTDAATETISQSRPISIWADAICIDQDSVEERNHQVNLMRLIFTRCEYTFSWLGEADENSDLAMDCIAKIASSPADELSTESFIWNLTQESPFYEADPWVAIHQLFRRDFWYRVWIFQELVLPKDLIVGCGSRSLPWSKFEELENLRGCDDLLARDGFLIREAITHLDTDIQDKIVAVCRILLTVLPNIGFLRENDRRPHSYDIEEMLHYSRHLQATDPRDKIYGFLALTTNHNIQPDYSKTTQQVYTEVARSILPHYPNLLAYSGISTRKNATSPSIASSWVPDWDWITRSAATVATTWKGLDLNSTYPGDYFGLRKFEFKHFPDVEVLRFRGQICHMVVNPTFYTKCLDPKNLAVAIRNMYGRSYPQWNDNNRPQEPISKLVALYRTFIQHGMTRGISEEHSELAAGFCYSISLRIGSSNDTETSIAKISLAILLQLFEKEFGEQPEAFSHSERYSDGYLAEEKASLHQRVFFETTAGHFGLGPPDVKDGDIICKIYGCRWPCVIRKVDSHYVLVGACWVLGFMDDQGLDKSHSEMIEIW